MCGAPAFLGAGGVFGFGWCGGVVPGCGGGVVRLVLGVFECFCVSVGFGIRLVLGWFRGLCTVAFLEILNVVVVVMVSVFRGFGLFCGLVGGGV